jgi:hypothetical protein
LAARIDRDAALSDHACLRQRERAHEFLHGLGALACDVDNAPLVLRESDGAVWHKQRKWNPVEFGRFKRAALQRLDPGLGDLLMQLGLLNPLNFWSQPCDCIPHALESSILKTIQLIVRAATPSRATRL